MKAIIRFLIISMITTLSASNIYSQCISDAGNDTIVCINFGIMDTIHLGGMPAAHNGTPPYTYTWSCDYYLGNGALHFTASVFLDDTTAANPKIISPPGELVDYLTFYLTVTDDIGNTCSDSITVRFSKFGITLEDKSHVINQGDSVQLYSGVGGGIPPLTYHWTPEYNLSDPDIEQPWANPDTNIAYAVTVTDSAGCSMTDPDYFEVSVIITSITEKTLNPISPVFLFPNPAKNIINIQLENIGNTVYVITDITGKTLISKQLTENQTSIDVSGLSKGIYFLMLKNERSILGIEKIIKQ